MVFSPRVEKISAVFSMNELFIPFESSAIFSFAPIVLRGFYVFACFVISQLLD